MQRLHLDAGAVDGVDEGLDGEEYRWANPVPEVAVVGAQVVSELRDKAIFAILLSLIGRIPVSDSASGMRVFRRETLATLSPLPTLDYASGTPLGGFWRLGVGPTPPRAPNFTGPDSRPRKSGKMAQEGTVVTVWLIPGR